MDHLIVWIMFSHWVADFLCQTHWMATNKSKSLLALTSHCLAYGFVLTYMVLMLGSRLGIDGILAFGAINMTLHLCVDAITSVATSILWQKTKIHAFFCVIGLDQFIHFVTLYVTMRMYLML